MEQNKIDMSKYVDSDEIHERCIGCNKVFDYTPIEGAITSQKCLTYSNPSAKWPYDGQEFAMHTVMVRKRDKHGLSVNLSKEIPVIGKYCPLASHYKADEVVNTSTKVRSGQQKQK